MTKSNTQRYYKHIYCSSASNH